MTARPSQAFPWCTSPPSPTPQYSGLYSLPSVMHGCLLRQNHSSSTIRSTCLRLCPAVSGQEAWRRGSTEHDRTGCRAGHKKCARNTCPRCRSCVRLNLEYVREYVRWVLGTVVKTARNLLLPGCYKDGRPSSRVCPCPKPANPPCS